MASLAEERQPSVYDASQWRLVWSSFFKHRLAVVGAAIVVLGYLVALFAEFVAPYDASEVTFVSPARSNQLIRPRVPRIIDADGRLRWFFVYSLIEARDQETLMVSYTEDTSTAYPVRLFVRGDPYRLFGSIRSDVHLWGVDDGLPFDHPDKTRLHLLGTDQKARDLFSRILHGTRISLSIGLLGVFMQFVLAVVFGTISGYFGGALDNAIQRLIEVLTSIPTLPLWMVLSISIPQSWPIVRVFFAITIILSLLSWPGLARQVRGKVLSLRETEYVVSARLDNASTSRIMFVHMIPGLMSHLIASLTLSIPGTILGETSLSFLGLGLHEPAISWGVLLQDAQQLRTILFAPWLMIPVLPVIIFILAFNFVGDGLRDAADPYKS
jgi:peptide/nickel transport system permease protein